MPKRKRPAVRLDPAEHRKNVAYGRRYRQNRRRVLGTSRVCALRYDGCTYWATETDHVREVARGGPSTVENLQPTCSNCNQVKAGQRRRGVAAGGVSPSAADRGRSLIPGSSSCPHRLANGEWCVGRPRHWSQWFISAETIVESLGRDADVARERSPDPAEGIA
jgi:HNH endonuclease